MPIPIDKHLTTWTEMLFVLLLWLVVTDGSLLIVWGLFKLAEHIYDKLVGE